MTAISTAYPIFNDIDGQPLEAGYVWIGLPNLDPVTNQKQVYWDQALTQPATQPIRTRGGYPLNGVAIGQLYTTPNYSIRVTNRNGSVLYNDPLVSSEMISVTDFGAVGDGVANDTAAIQAAVNYAQTFAQGAKILFPSGKYLLNTTVTVTGSGVSLEGSGQGNTWIINGTANAAAIQFGSNAAFINRNSIENFVFGQATGVVPSTGNCGLYAVKCTNIVVKNIQVFQFPTSLYDGVVFNSVVQSYIDTIGIQNCTNVGLTLKNQTFDIYLSNGRCDANAYGVDIRDTQGLYFTNWSCYGNSVYGWRLTTDGAFEYNQYLFFTNCIGDTSGSHNWYVDKVSILVFSGCWAATQNSQSVNVNSDGFHFNGTVVSDVTMSGCVTLSNNRHGVNFAQIQKASVTGGSFGSSFKPAAFGGLGVGNGIGAGGANGSGIHIGSLANRITVNGVTSEGNQLYGIDVASGATEVNLLNSQLKFNTVGQIRNQANASSGQCVIKNNDGFNPPGFLTAPAIPASTVAVTNLFGVDAMVYISGGTISEVTVASVNVLNVTNSSVLVPAGSTIAITYTVAPTWQWLGM